jgi:hypothetical protein
MGLLSHSAIELLGRLSEAWIDVDKLELRADAPALLELEREGLVRTQIVPPPMPGYRYRPDVDDRRRRRLEVQRTLRGAGRLHRIREGARNRR